MIENNHISKIKELFEKRFQNEVFLLASEHLEEDQIKKENILHEILKISNNRLEAFAEAVDLELDSYLDDLKFDIEDFVEQMELKEMSMELENLSNNKEFLNWVVDETIWEDDKKIEEKQEIETNWGDIDFET